MVRQKVQKYLGTRRLYPLWLNLKSNDGNVTGAFDISVTCQEGWKGVNFLIEVYVKECQQEFHLGCH